MSFPSAKRKPGVSPANIKGKQDNALPFNAGPVNKGPDSKPGSYIEGETGTAPDMAQTKS